MKKLLILLFSNLILLFSNAQSHNQGAFSFTLGYDAGIHGVTYTSEYNSTIVDQDTSGSATRMAHLTASYNIFKFMSIGLDLRSGSYLEDPENATANGNKVSMSALNLRFYPVNKDKFAWYIGPTFGFSRLEINRIYTFIVSIPAQYRFKSGHFGLETGFNWYFVKNFGMNFALGYSSQNFNMYYYRLNGEEQDLSNYENTLKTAGVHMNIGLSYHFGGR
jgi:hypothetical protein